MNLDLTKLAEQVRSAHANGVPLRLPAMTARQVGVLVQLLDTPLISTAKFLH